MKPLEQIESIVAPVLLKSSLEIPTLASMSIPRASFSSDASSSQEGLLKERLHTSIREPVSYSADNTASSSMCMSKFEETYPSLPCEDVDYTKAPPSVSRKQSAQYMGTTRPVVRVVKKKIYCEDPSRNSLHQLKDLQSQPAGKAELLENYLQSNSRGDGLSESTTASKLVRTVKSGDVSVHLSNALEDESIFTDEEYNQAPSINDLSCGARHDLISAPESRSNSPQVRKSKVVGGLPDVESNLNLDLGRYRDARMEYDPKALPLLNSSFEADIEKCRTVGGIRKEHSTSLEAILTGRFFEEVELHRRIVLVCQMSSTARAENSTFNNDSEVKLITYYDC